MTASDETPLASTWQECPVSTADPEAAIHRWLQEYICLPHEQLGRDGAVCPFVEPAMRSETLLVRSRTGLANEGLSSLRTLIREMTGMFRAAEWPRSNVAMRALLLVMPDLPMSQWTLLDKAQAQMKAGLAHEGLMLGQFHPHCPEPAARNPWFPVSRSPIPLLAMRNMALHDVLFLHHDRELFAAYRHRFGDRYERGIGGDHLFRELYETATAQYADSDRPIVPSTASRTMHGETTEPNGRAR